MHRSLVRKILILTALSFCSIAIFGNEKEGPYLKTDDITNEIIPGNYVLLRYYSHLFYESKALKAYKQALMKDHAHFKGNLIFATRDSHESVVGWPTTEGHVVVLKEDRNRGMDFFLKHCEKTYFKKEIYPYVRCFDERGDNIGYVFKKKREGFETPEFYYELMKLFHAAPGGSDHRDRDSVEYYRNFGTIYTFGIRLVTFGFFSFNSDVVTSPNAKSPEGGDGISSDSYRFIITDNYIYFTNLFNLLDDLHHRRDEEESTSSPRYQTDELLARHGTLFVFVDENRSVPLVKDFPFINEARKKDVRKYSKKKKRWVIEDELYFPKEALEFYKKARDAGRAQGKEISK